MPQPVQQRLGRHPQLRARWRRTARARKAAWLPVRLSGRRKPGRTQAASASRTRAWIAPIDSLAASSTIKRSSILTRPASGRTQPPETLSRSRCNWPAFASAGVRPKSAPARGAGEGRHLPLLSTPPFPLLRLRFTGVAAASHRNRGCFGDVPRPRAPSSPSPSERIPYRYIPARKISNFSKRKNNSVAANLPLRLSVRKVQPLRSSSGRLISSER